MAHADLERGAADTCKRGHKGVMSDLGVGWVSGARVGEGVDIHAQRSRDREGESPRKYVSEKRELFKVATVHMPGRLGRARACVSVSVRVRVWVSALRVWVCVCGGWLVLGVDLVLAELVLERTEVKEPVPEPGDQPGPEDVPCQQRPHPAKLKRRGLRCAWQQV